MLAEEQIYQNIKGKKGGAVVSAAINKYIYVIVNKKFDNKIRISYSKTEMVDSVEDIEHPSVRESLKLLGIDGGIEILSISDIPSKGTGLGSSSTFLVGLLNALHAYKGELTSREELAREAVLIEREILKEPGGKQDQYMAAYGGINLMNFNQDESVYVKPLSINAKSLEDFRNHLLLLYTGIQRNSTDIHKKQREEVIKKEEYYDEMKELAYTFFEAVYKAEYPRIGAIMDANWKNKKKLTDGISNDTIDNLYELAMKKGAYGGKLIGAGGGGFLLFVCEPSDSDDIVKTLSLRKIDFDFEGSRIIYVSKD